MPGADRPTVVHVSSARSWRGGEVQAVALYQHLSALGLEQVMVCPRGSAVERVCQERGLRHLAAPRRGSWDPLFARAVARAAADAGADLVHAHDPHAHTAAVLASALFRSRAGVIAHRRVVFPIGRGLATRWKYDHRSVRRIVCVSRAAAEVVARSVADPSRIRVVPSGIDPKRFPAEADGRLRREHGVPPGVPLVGYVAALTPEKDHATFLEVARLATARGLDARFLAVGEGSERAAIEALVREKRLEGRVILTGFRADIPQVMRELDLLLFTSTAEGFPSTLADAFVCRVPVVATRAGGIPELVTDGETGLLCPVGDAPALAEAVWRVLREPRVRERLVAAALAASVEHTFERMAARTLAVYREALA